MTIDINRSIFQKSSMTRASQRWSRKDRHDWRRANLTPVGAVSRAEVDEPLAGDAQTTVAVICAELELEDKIHGFTDLSRSRNCSAVQSINTRRRGDNWRVWE